MSSSGCRVSETIQLKKRDLEIGKYDRILVKLPAKITKTKRARITFLSKECEKELLPFLKRISDDSYIFNSTLQKRTIASVNEIRAFSRLRYKLELNKKYDSGVHKISLTGSMRSWFVTKCNRIDQNFGNGLAGHLQYLHQYDRLTIQEKVELYKKAEQSLQVFEYVDEDNEKKIASLEKRLKELEIKEKEMVDISPMASIMLCAMKNDPEFKKMVNYIAEKSKVSEAT